MTDYIKVENLKRIYKPSKLVEVRALDGLSFAFEKGSFVSVIGSSGSGKSTFLNILGGLDWNYSGHIFINVSTILPHSFSYC